jgi:hypothetical protein
MLELLWALNDNPQTFSNRYGRELEGLMGAGVGFFHRSRHRRHWLGRHAS